MAPFGPHNRRGGNGGNGDQAGRGGRGNFISNGRGSGGGGNGYRGGWRGNNSNSSNMGGNRGNFNHGGNRHWNNNNSSNMGGNRGNFNHSGNRHWNNNSNTGRDRGNNQNGHRHWNNNNQGVFGRGINGLGADGGRGDRGGRGGNRGRSGRNGDAYNQGGDQDQTLFGVGNNQGRGVFGANNERSGRRNRNNRVVHFQDSDVDMIDHVPSSAGISEGANVGFYSSHQQSNDNDIELDDSEDQHKLGNFDDPYSEEEEEMDRVTAVMVKKQALALRRSQPDLMKLRDQLSRLQGRRTWVKNPRFPTYHMPVVPEAQTQDHNVGGSHASEVKMGSDRANPSEWTGSNVEAEQLRQTAMKHGHQVVQRAHEGHNRLYDARAGGHLPSIVAHRRSGEWFEMDHRAKGWLLDLSKRGDVELQLSPGDSQRYALVITMADEDEFLGVREWYNRVLDVGLEKVLVETGV